MTQDDREEPDQLNRLTETAEADNFDPVVMALRDLERKRAEIEAAIEAILASRPDLRRRN